MITNAMVDWLREFCRYSQRRELTRIISSRGFARDYGGSFQELICIFEKLKTLPDGLTRALLLVEVQGSVQKLQIQLLPLKKA
jgi:hypothetical protein